MTEQEYQKQLNVLKYKWEKSKQETSLLKKVYCEKLIEGNKFIVNEDIHYHKCSNCGIVKQRTFLRKISDNRLVCQTCYKYNYNLR